MQVNLCQPDGGDIALQQMGWRRVEKTCGVQMSANGTPDNSRIGPKRDGAPVSRPAGRMKGTETPRPTPRALHVAAGQSGAPNWDVPTVVTVPVRDAAPETQEAKSFLVRNLSPRQVLAAQMLAQGRRGIEVAKALNLSEETVSRWRQRPEFQALMRQLLQETIDATRLGIVSLCAESIEHLRGLVRSFNDETSLKAITLILSRVGPVLGVIGASSLPPPDRGPQ